MTEVGDISSQHRIGFLERALLLCLKTVHVVLCRQDERLIVFVDHLSQFRVVWQLKLVGLLRWQAATQENIIALLKGLG